jgi:hypothetical protein
MNRRTVSEYLIGGTSVIVFLSSFAHAWPGWAGVRQALQGHVEPPVISAIDIGWHFGSVSMATFGLLGLRSVALLRRGFAEARSTPLAIGTAYVLFGAGAMISTHLKPHFLFFVVLGALLLVGALLWSPARMRTGNEQGRSPR